MTTMRDRFAATTEDLLDVDPRAALVLADIGVSNMARVLRRHPRRAVNVGIREQLMIGVATGMAIEGFRPIAHSYAPFLVERAFEQVKLIEHQNTGVVLVSVGASYDWAPGGRTHQAPEDVSLMLSLPDVAVHVPGHPDEVDVLLRRAVAGDTTTYMRLSDAQNETAAPDDPSRISVIREGSDGAATILAIGPTLQPVVDATSGDDVTILYTATAAPFDHPGLLQALSGDALAVVEPGLRAGMAPVIVDALRHRRSRVVYHGVGRRELRHYGTRLEHDQAHGLDAAGIRRAISPLLHSHTEGPRLAHLV